MANTVYTQAKQHMVTGGVDWLNDDIKIALVDLDDYTPDFALDEFLADIPGAAIVDTSGNLTGKTAVDGLCNADDVLVSGVSGDEFEAVLVYQDTGNPATSVLLCLLDTGSGLPFVPSGGNLLIQWLNLSPFIFGIT